MRIAHLAVLISMAGLVVACGEDPTDPDSSLEFTHPEGIVDSLLLPGRPYGVALLPDSTALITQVDLDRATILDLYDRTILGQIPLGTTPSDITASPDGAFAYVTNHFGHSIGRIDTEAMTHEDFVLIENDPVTLLLSSDGSRIYATDNQHSLFIIDAATGAIQKTLQFGEALSGLALHPVEPRLYVTSRLTGEVCTVDTRAQMLIGCRYDGGRPERQIVDPSGERLFTCNEDQELLYVWSLEENRLLQAVPIGPCNFMAFSPDHEQLWITQSLAYRVTVLDPGSLEVLWSMDTARRPRRVRFTERGDRVVIAAEGGRVYIVR